MNVDTCIKTKPTTMADDEFQVNIHLCNINMNILLLLYFVKILFLERLRKHPGSRNLRDDNDLDGNDGATWLLFPRSVLVQMGSVKWKVLAAVFRFYVHFYEFVAIFLVITKLHFSGSKICMSNQIPQIRADHFFTIFSRKLVFTLSYFFYFFYVHRMAQPL